MLNRLRIDNLLILPAAEIEFNAGLVCITGETGAGKTLFGQSLNLVFGESADPRLIGNHGSESWIESEWNLTNPALSRVVDAAFAEIKPSDEQEIILARRLIKDGRARSLAWGRSVNKAILVEARAALFMHVGQGSARELLSKFCVGHLQIS